MQRPNFDFDNSNNMNYLHQQIFDHSVGRKQFEKPQTEISQNNIFQYTYNNPYQNFNQKNFDRNLETKDIPGAIPNTLISPALKNLEKAKQYQQINQQKLYAEQQVRDQESKELEIQYDKVPYQYSQQPSQQQYQQNQQQQQYEQSIDKNNNYSAQQVPDKFQANVENFFRGTTPDTYSQQIYENQNIILNSLQKKVQQKKAEEYEKRLDMIKSEGFINNLGSFYDEQGQNQQQLYQQQYQQPYNKNQNQQIYQQQQQQLQQQQYANKQCQQTPIQYQKQQIKDENLLSEIDRLKLRINQLEVQNSQSGSLIPQQQNQQQISKQQSNLQPQGSQQKPIQYQQQISGFPVEAGKLQLTPNIYIKQKQMGRYSPTSLSFAGENQLIAEENQLITRDLQNQDQANNQLLQDENERKFKEFQYLNQLKLQMEQQQSPVFMAPNVGGNKKVHRFGGMKNLYS